MLLGDSNFGVYVAFFFCKQETAYEMRISDWSSDVCSSELGFVGSSRPFFDQRAIEEDALPLRWTRLWKLHGSINWRFNKQSKAIFRSREKSDADLELLIHPSHRKYDESRRMPYFVMIDRLRHFLRNDGRPVAPIALGYPFSDEPKRKTVGLGK